MPNQSETFYAKVIGNGLDVRSTGPNRKITVSRRIGAVGGAFGLDYSPHEWLM
jgi:hypothetical protein